MEVKLDHTDVEKLRSRWAAGAAAVARSETVGHLRRASVELLKAASSLLQAAITRLEPEASAPEEPDEDG